MKDIANRRAQIRDPHMTDQTARAEQGVQLILLSSSNNKTVSKISHHCNARFSGKKNKQKKKITARSSNRNADFPCSSQQVDRKSLRISAQRLLRLPDYTLLKPLFHQITFVN